jgi:DNA-directed RNA polymerase specialized sigma subunit
LPTTIKYTAEQLTRLTQRKDKGELGKLYDRYSPALYGAILRILNQNQKMAEDVLREVFVKVWNEIETFDSSKETLFIWLLRIARSTAHDKLHSSHLDQSGIASNISFSNKNITSELSDTSQAIIDLVYAGKYSLKEISQQLCPRNQLNQSFGKL